MTPEQLEAHRVRFEQQYAADRGWIVKTVRDYRHSTGYNHSYLHQAWQAYQWALADADRAQRAAPGAQGAAPMIAGCSVCYGSGIDVAGRPCPFAPHRIGATTPAMYGNKPPQQSAQPVALPRVDAPEAVAALDAMNKEYNYPANPANCARYGWEAARRFLAAQPVEVQRHAVSLSKDRQNRIYIAGPMTGYAEFNFPAFNVMADKLRAQGFHVENPAEHGIVDGAEWADYLHYDIGRLATCAYLMLLPGWSKSKGAALEVSIARGLGMGINFAEGAEAQPVEVQRVPLTKAEIERIYHRYGGDMMNCTRAIERAFDAKVTRTVGLTPEQLEEIAKAIYAASKSYLWMANYCYEELTPDDQEICREMGRAAHGIFPANSESPTLPAAAVAEGAQLDGESLEQAE